MPNFQFKQGKRKGVTFAFMDGKHIATIQKGNESKYVLIWEGKRYGFQQVQHAKNWLMKQLGVERGNTAPSSQASQMAKDIREYSRQISAGADWHDEVRSARILDNPMVVDEGDIAYIRYDDGSILKADYEALRATVVRNKKELEYAHDLLDREGKRYR